MDIKFRDLRLVVELIKKQTQEHNSYCDFVTIEKSSSLDYVTFRFTDNFRNVKEIQVFDKSKQKNPIVQHMEDATKLVNLD